MSEVPILRRQLRSEKKQKGYAWFKFYEAESKNHEQSIQTINTLQEFVPNFIQNELKDLYTKLKTEISCPICLEELQTDQIKFSSCGHKYCADCLSKIDKCALCKKKIYKSNT